MKRSDKEFGPFVWWVKEYCESKDNGVSVSLNPRTGKFIFKRNENNGKN